jgi:ABC-type thiamine transport system ATPase subunit
MPGCSARRPRSGSRSCSPRSRWSPTPVAPPDRPLAPRLSFEGVAFRYPERAAPAHRDVSFEVAPGERVAIVGPSGSGKTSIVRLLLRFYDPERGRVALDGVDIRDLDVQGLRRHFAVVSQDCYLFHGSVAENLRLAKPEATLDELRRVATAANALGFIEALPQGFDTLVGERGVRLSGGQRQRIAIARALLRDAPILDPRRSALLGRRRERGDRAGGDRSPDARAHDAGDRAPPLEHPHRRPHRRARARPRRRDRHARSADGARRRLSRADGGAGSGDARPPGDRSAGRDRRIDDRPGARRPRQMSAPAASRAPLGWPVVLRELLAWVAPLKLALGGTLLLGLARVAAFVAVPVLGALILRALVRGEDSRALSPGRCASWRRSPGCCTGSNPGSRTTSPIGCSPRCASRSIASSTSWRRPICCAGDRAISSPARRRTSRRSSISSPTPWRRPASRCWCRWWRWLGSRARIGWSRSPSCRRCSPPRSIPSARARASMRWAARRARRWAS